MAKLSKSQQRKLLIDGHAKFVKLFGSQKVGQNFVTPTDLNELLKIVNRINGRMDK